MAQVESAHHWYVLVLQGNSSNTLDFSQNIKVSSLFLGVPFLIFPCPTFFEEAPKFLVNLMSTYV